MAKKKDEIPVGSTWAFYEWVKLKYPGWWPQDMSKIDWTSGRNLEMYNQWVTEEKVSTPVPAGQTPFPDPTKKTGATSYTVVYGGSVWQGNDGKYYDPATGFLLSDDELKYRYQKYLQDNPQDEDPRLALDKAKWAWEKGEAEREQWRQQAEAKNKEWVAQYNLQSEASQSAIEKQRNELELIKGRAFPFGDEAGRNRAFQEARAGAYESARQSILASLSSPSDWIKRWDVQNAPNPYTPQPVSATEQAQSQLSNTETRAKMFDQMADESEKLVNTLANDPSYGVGPNSPIEAGVLTQARADVANYRNAANAERGNLPAYQSDVTYLQGQPQPVPSQLGGRGSAPAPGWLPMFAPGQQAGRPITRENVATPSAQQWSSTPWSVQQGLSGYLDWAGYRPMADVLGNMAQMLPNAPGGGSRWSPYIGR